MTDTNEDRLEVIKDALWRVDCPSVAQVEIDWLVQEVERLSDAYNELTCVSIDQEDKEKSLTKERDERKERYMKSTRKDFIEKVEKLEAENAKLREQCLTIGQEKYIEAVEPLEKEITDLKQKRENERLAMMKVSFENKTIKQKLAEVEENGKD